MKKLLSVILLLAVGGLLAKTNPDEADFRAWVEGRIEERLSSEAGRGRLGRILTDLGSSIAGTVATKAAERRDWLLFSTYTIDLGADAQSDEKWRFVGVGGQFLEIATPDAVR